MRLSIGHRLFISVLLAILAVAATAAVLMRQNVTRSFGDYALSIELDRLDELSRHLARQHAQSGTWTFIPEAQNARQGWIAVELGRLQVARGLPAPPPPPPAPAPPQEPAPPPAADGFIAPPLPPPAVPPIPATLQEPLADQLALQDRVTLLDAQGRYLAGRMPNPSEEAVRRAISSAGQTIGYLAVSKAARPSDAMSAAFLDQLKQSLWVIIAASVVLSAVAATLLAAHFRGPILRLADGARELAAGRYGTRLDAARSDELGTLAASFNQLAEKLDLAESSRRQWVADTSHELRTPLSVLRAQLEAMQDGVRPANAETMAAMLKQVMALNKLIDQLYVLAKADVGELECRRVPTDLWQLAIDQAGAFHERFAAASITLDATAPDGACRVSADPDRIGQLLANVFENCIRYCGSGARVVMATQHDGKWLHLTIDDNGPGVPDAALPQLAQRFYRVDASRSREHGGAGLGLSLAQRIAAAHGGTLAFTRSPLGGLQVRLTLEKA